MSPAQRFILTLLLLAATSAAGAAEAPLPVPNGDAPAASSPPQAAPVTPPAPGNPPPTPPPAGEMPAAPPHPVGGQAATPPGVVSHRSNLDTFMSYRGERSPAILTALIGREISPTIRQEPAVALSDGRTRVRITVRLAPGDGSSPNFAPTGASLLSIARDPASPQSWVITLLPRQNASGASLTILSGNQLIDYPLTVAPPVAEVTGSEADFALFLRDSGVSPPRRDLNGDGRHDYLDDFIYTANYLARKNAASGAGK